MCGGQPSVYLLPNSALQALHHIDSHAGPRLGAGVQRAADKGTRGQFSVDSLIKEAITSSQLEGASTVRAVAAEITRRPAPT